MIDGLPQWRCHKVVGAFKIGGIVQDGEFRYRVVPDPDVPSDAHLGQGVEVSVETFRARTSDNSRPLRFPAEYIGGYLVQYEDGYLSWSPAKAFEDGYTRIG
jgi:hypothetical protein